MVDVHDDLTPDGEMYPAPYSAYNVVTLTVIAIPFKLIGRGPKLSDIIIEFALVGSVAALDIFVVSIMLVLTRLPLLSKPRGIRVIFSVLSFPFLIMRICCPLLFQKKLMHEFQQHHLFLS